MTPRITLLLGTSREGNRSHHVAEYIRDQLSGRTDITLAYHTVAEFPTTATIPPGEESPHTKPWKEVVANTDAFIVVVPEYNFTFPGEYKMVMDQDLEGYRGKPVLLCTVSAGPFGGMRSLAAHLLVFCDLGLVHVPYQLAFGMVKEFLAMSKEERDQNYKHRVERGVAALLAYQQHLSGIGDELAELR